MASKRYLRRHSCESKRRYATEAEARSHAGRGLHAYKCDFGNHWHLGHGATKDRAQIKADRQRGAM